MDFFLPGFHAAFEVIQIGHAKAGLESLNGDLTAHPHPAIKYNGAMGFDLAKVLHDFRQWYECATDIKGLMFRYFPNINELKIVAGI